MDSMNLAKMLEPNTLYRKHAASDVYDVVMCDVCR